MGLVRNLYLVLTNEQVRMQLQLNARHTAEQFKPVAIAERWLLASPTMPCLVTATSQRCTPDGISTAHVNSLSQPVYTGCACTEMDKKNIMQAAEPCRLHSCMMMSQAGALMHAGRDLVWCSLYQCKDITNRLGLQWHDCMMMF